MTGFLSIPAEEIDNVPDPSVVETKEEVLLRVTDIREGINKNQEPYIQVRFTFVDYPDSLTFQKYFALPFDGMDKSKRNGAIRRLKYFYQAFDIDYSSGEVTADMIIGAEGWAFVDVDPQEGSEYGPQNFIKRFIVPGE